MYNNVKMMSIGGLLGLSTVIAANLMVMFSNRMVNYGYPDIAKLPIKLLDEATQRSSSPDYGKALVSVAAGFAEASIDVIYQSTRKSDYIYYLKGGYLWK